MSTVDSNGGIADHPKDNKTENEGNKEINQKLQSDPVPDTNSGPPLGTDTDTESSTTAEEESPIAKDVVEHVGTSHVQDDAESSAPPELAAELVAEEPDPKEEVDETAKEELERGSPANGEDTNQADPKSQEPDNVNQTVVDSPSFFPEEASESLPSRQEDDAAEVTKTSSDTEPSTEEPLVTSGEQEQPVDEQVKEDVGDFTVPKVENEPNTLPETAENLMRLEEQRSQSLSEAMPLNYPSLDDDENSMVKPATVPDFTQDPFDIQEPSYYSQIPTPAGSQPASRHGTPPDDELTLPVGFEPPMPPTPGINPLAPVFPKTMTATETGRPLKKSVSIVPHTPEKLEERPRKAVPIMPRERAPTGDSTSYNETTPLLGPSTSLPTVVGYDDTNSVIEYPGPSTHTRSEIGHREFRRKKKRSRRRRQNTHRSVEPAKLHRPFIASPFMPIPTQLSCEHDRRSVVGTPREQRVLSTGYGTVRRTDEPLLKKESSEECADESEDDEEEEDEEAPEGETDSSVSSKRSSLFELTSKEWATIIMLSLANLCSTIAFSCIAPFYPAEATLKGMTESQTGMVFGIFELTMFITAPLFGKWMIKVGSKRMFVLGVLITGLTAILFGFLNFLPSGTLFFWASLIIRVLEAVGDAAFVTSSFAISAKCFPGRIALVVGVLETFAGLGYTAGPPIGGFLYEFGGFQAPFLVLGVVLLLAAFLSVWLIEDLDEECETDDGNKGLITMLKIPIVWIMIYAVVVCAISLSFLDPTLAQHLESFNLSPSMIGLMFLLCGGIYTLSAPFWGLIIDRYHCTVALLIFGSVTTVVAMLIIGPAPFLPIEKNLVLIGVALAILGVAAGAQYIPTFQTCLDALKEKGYDDSFRTYGCVSGLFQSAFAFGGFFGPTVGGFAVEQIGFAWTTTIVGAIHVIYILTVIVFYGAQSCRRGNSVSSSTPVV